MRGIPPGTAFAPGTLFHNVSWEEHRGKALFFGKNADHRYDDPLKQFGVLYVAPKLSSALMESVFHKHQWFRESRPRSISRTMLEKRMVRMIGVVDPIVVADLTQDDVMAACLGVDLETLVCRDYGYTQGLSRSIHQLVDDDGQPLFDGIRYPSRNDYPAGCIALFDRTTGRVHVETDIALARHADWPPFVAKHEVAIVDG